MQDLARAADIKYGALAEVGDLLKRKQAEAKRADRMLSDTVGPEEIATVRDGHSVHSVHSRALRDATGSAARACPAPAAAAAEHAVWLRPLALACTAPAPELTSC